MKREDKRTSTSASPAPAHRRGVQRAKARFTSFKYRLYSIGRQYRLLSRWLGELRWLWHSLLAQRKQAWEERQETIDWDNQNAEPPSLQADLRPRLKQVHSQVAQAVALRLKRAMDAFRRWLTAGETPGYPRFHGQGRYDSPPYPQWDNGVRRSVSGTRLPLSKIGDVTIILHRPLEGTTKTATTRRIVNEFAVSALEDLSVTSTVQHGPARSRTATSPRVSTTPRGVSLRH
jgi:transposase